MMIPDDIDNVARATLSVAKKAGDLLRSMQFRPMDVSRKIGRDVVTSADKRSDSLLKEQLVALMPQAQIVSEEQDANDEEEAQLRWIVDPLDGTVNYASGLPWYGVSIALVEARKVRIGAVNFPNLEITAAIADGHLVVEPQDRIRVSNVSNLSDSVVSVVLTSHFSPDLIRRTVDTLNRLSARARGVRVIICGAYELYLVACGALDGFVSLKSDAFSVAASLPLVVNAGGRVSSPCGSPASHDSKELVVSNGHIHRELCDAIA